MQEEIIKIKEEAEKEIVLVKDLLILENLERKYLGRNGKLRDLILRLKNLVDVEKRNFGQLINQAKKEIEFLIQKKETEIKKLKLVTGQVIDVTLPAEKISYGHLHPLTQLKNEVAEIFKSIGFEILEGPEIENEYYNFETLNILADHPARDMWDTFYLRKNDKPETINNKQKSLKSKVYSLKSEVLLL
ncbi:MAG: hypothetical protein KGZ85_07340, partial [Ignavibacterium sp.]|nr:hypothetical protein [Ignavibacterium sp.]